MNRDNDTIPVAVELQTNFKTSLGIKTYVTKFKAFVQLAILDNKVTTDRFLIHCVNSKTSNELRDPKQPSGNENWVEALR